MLINIVAMDMLKSKIPPGKTQLPTFRLCLSLTSSCTFSEKWETLGYPQQTSHPCAWRGPLQRGRWRMGDKEIISGLYWFLYQDQAQVVPVVWGRDQRISRRSCRPGTRSMALMDLTIFPRYSYRHWSRHSWSWCPVTRVTCAVSNLLDIWREILFINFHLRRWKAWAQVRAQRPVSVLKLHEGKFMGAANNLNLIASCLCISCFNFP